MNSRFPTFEFFSENLLIIGAIYLTLCFCIAWFWGRKRKVGFMWSFVFSLLMTPLVGIAITLAGRKRKGDYI